MIDVRIGSCREPSPTARVAGKILNHIFVNLFLQVNPDCAIRADDFVGANTCVGRYVAPGVWNSNIGGIIQDSMVCPFNRRGYKSLEELLLRVRIRGS